MSTGWKGLGKANISLDLGKLGPSTKPTYFVGGGEQTHAGAVTTEHIQSPTPERKQEGTSLTRLFQRASWESWLEAAGGILLPVCPRGGALGLRGRASPSNLRALSGEACAMDSESLLLSLELASGSGQGLSPDRRASLLTSLTLVKRDYRFDRVLFWGRILGLIADYYIAQGLSEDQLAPRKTLYRWRLQGNTEGKATG